MSEVMMVERCVIATPMETAALLDDKAMTFMPVEMEMCIGVVMMVGKVMTTAVGMI
jgi:hypothetical protein